MYTNDHVGSRILVNRYDVSDVIDSELPRVMSVIVAAHVQTVQDLHGVRKTHTDTHDKLSD